MKNILNHLQLHYVIHYITVERINKIHIFDCKYSKKEYIYKTSYSKLSL